VAAEPVLAPVGTDPAGGGEQPALDASEPAETGRVEAAEVPVEAPQTVEAPAEIAVEQPAEIPAEEPAAEAPKENP
jgi:hypothetical protein